MAKTLVIKRNNKTTAKPQDKTQKTPNSKTASAKKAPAKVGGRSAKRNPAPKQTVKSVVADVHALGLAYDIDSPSMMVNMINTRNAQAVVVATLDSTGATFLGYHTDEEAVALAKSLSRMRKIKFRNVAVIESDFSFRKAQDRRHAATDRRTAVKNGTAKPKVTGKPTRKTSHQKALDKAPAAGTTKWIVGGKKTLSSVMAVNVYDAKRQVAASMKMPRGWTHVWVKESNGSYIMVWSNSKGTEQKAHQIVLRTAKVDAAAKKAAAKRK